MKRCTCKPVFSLIFACLTISYAIATSQEDKNFWYQQGQAKVAESLRRKLNNNVAKNLIMMVGGGMGMSTITAARIYKGQQDGQSGEETELSFERFPYSGLLKTYNTDVQNPDSAPCMTALISGVKTKSGILGMDDNAIFGNCQSGNGAEVESLLDWALRAGKSVGIISNTRITHATPAAAYANTPSRDWEGDTQLDPSQPGCTDIAYQLIKDNPNIQVILGGGRRFFLSKDEIDPELKTAHEDQRNDMSLVQEWIKDKKQRHKSHAYVWRKKEFDRINPDNTDYLLGLFESSHMAYEHERDSSPNGEPSLKEMTEKAIRILSKNKNGFFLFVESGRIDQAHHDTKSRRALDETVMFDATVKLATEMTSQDDTLLLVTADHSHVFTIGGRYPKRGNDILGFVNDAVAGDGLPYTTIFYANGQVQRSNITGVDTRSFDFQFQSGVNLYSESHSAEDVPIYASGPMSHLFLGTNEQSYVAHAASYAMQIGPNKHHSRQRRVKSKKILHILRNAFKFITK